MNYMRLVLGVALLAVPTVAIAQQPAAPLPDEAPGALAEPVPSARSDNAMVVVPPVTDPRAVAQPPRNVDPEIDDMTEQWDKKDHAGKRKKAHGKRDNTIQQEQSTKALSRKE